MTTYWLSNICSLFDSLSLNPFYSKDRNANYNALTRLIIFVIIVALLINPNEKEQILLAGGASLLLSIIIYLCTMNSENKEEVINQVDNIRGSTGETININSIPGTTDNTLDLGLQNTNIPQDRREALEKLVKDTGTNLDISIFNDLRENERAGLGRDWVSRQRNDNIGTSVDFTGRKQPNFSQFVSKNPYNPYKFTDLPTGKEVQTGTLKQYHSIKGTNLSHTGGGLGTMSSAEGPVGTPGFSGVTGLAHPIGGQALDNGGNSGFTDGAVNSWGTPVGAGGIAIAT